MIFEIIGLILMIIIFLILNLMMALVVYMKIFADEAIKRDMELSIKAFFRYNLIWHK